MNKEIKKIYDEVYNLFPENTGKRELLYRQREWIFPHHIDIMLEMAEKLCKKYSGNLQICQIAIILHDTGLVYHRKGASSKGHEENSLRYAKIILEKYCIEEKIQKNILACIQATESMSDAVTIEEKIVRTVDALSQFKSIHFIAKAAFSGNFETYLPWLRKKVKYGFEKICFADEKKEIEFIQEYYNHVIALYGKMEKKIKHAN